MLCANCSSFTCVNSLFNDRAEEGNEVMASFKSAGLPGLEIGVKIACFKVTGTLQWLSDKLKCFAR